MSTAGNVLHDHQPIVLTKLVAVCEGIDLSIQLGYSDIEVEFDSTAILSWITSYGSMQWNFAYLLGRVCALSSSLSLLIRHVFFERLHLLLILWPTRHVLISVFIVTFQLV